MKNSELIGREVAVFALYLAGGASSHIDTEDLAVRMNEIAPGRFTWRKYPDQINLETIRVFLSDAKKEKNGRMVDGSGRKGWRLTEAGLEFAKSVEAQVAVSHLSRDTRPTQRELTWRRAERRRLMATEAFCRYVDGGIAALTVDMAGEFFRVDDYVTEAAREGKIVRIVDVFGSDPDLSELVHILSAMVRQP